MSAARDEKIHPNDEKESIFSSHTLVDLKTEAIPFNFQKVWCAETLLDNRIIISEAKVDWTGILTVWNLNTGECEAIIRAKKFVRKIKVLTDGRLMMDDITDIVNQVSFSEPAKQNPAQNEMKISSPTAIPIVDLQYHRSCCIDFGNSIARIFCCPFWPWGQESFDMTSKNERVIVDPWGKISLNDDLRNAMYPTKPMQYYCCTKLHNKNPNNFCTKHCLCFGCAFASTQIDFRTANFPGSCCLSLYDQWQNLSRLTDDVMLLSNDRKHSMTLVNIRNGQFSEDYKLELPPGALASHPIIAANQLKFFAYGFLHAHSFKIFKLEDNLRLEYFGTVDSLLHIQNIKPLRSGTGFAVLDAKGIHLYDLETRKIIPSLSHNDQEKIHADTFHIRQRDGAVIYLTTKNRAGTLRYQREVDFFEYKKDLQSARTFRIVCKKLPVRKKEIIKNLISKIHEYVVPDYYGKFFKSRDQQLPEVDHATGMPKRTIAPPVMTRT